MHSIRYVSFSTKSTRKDIIAKCNKVANRDGDYKDQISHIEFDVRKTVFENYEKAENWIKDHDGYYRNFAVQYYQYPECDTAKYKKAKERVDVLQHETQEKESEVYARTLSSKYLGCKCCGSSIATSYIRGNHCPVCNNDLRPAYWMKKIESSQEKLKKAQDAVKEIEKEWNDTQKNKANIMWLVKFEYHC